MSAADPHSILYRGPDPLKVDPNVIPEKKTVARHWPGKAPEWDEVAEEETEIPSFEKQEYIDSITIVPDRLLRLQANNESKEARLQRRRRKVEAEVVEDEDMDDIKQELIKQQLGALKEAVKAEVVEEESSEEEKDIDRELRRQRAKEKSMKIRKEEEEVLEKEEWSDEEEELEVESDDADDDIGLTFLKPVFVCKNQRDTVLEKEQQELEEEALEYERAQRAKEKKHESSKLLVEVIRREEEEELEKEREIDKLSDTEMPPDDDDVQEDEAYEMWKIRELKRIKRDKEEREQRALLVLEIERRRDMTDIERIEDNKRIDALYPKAEKVYRFGYLQKYYHKGAFFQDKAQDGTESIYLRDFQAPVGEDKLDKKMLPEAMKKRRGNFGRAGQVKHTHLTDVDTTDFSGAWAQDERASMRTTVIGARPDTFDRPGKAKKEKTNIISIIMRE